MSWDPVWDDVFKNRAYGKYPNESLIRFVATHFFEAPTRKTIKLLDLGCGAGAATWLMCREGFDVFAIDGSAEAIKRLTNILQAENLHADLKISDIQTLPYPEEYFDGVIEIGCLMCNNTANTTAILREIHRVLKPSGRFFSYSASTKCDGYGLGIPVEPNAYLNAEYGPFANMGLIRFMDENAISDLYGSIFGKITVDYNRYSGGGQTHNMDFWCITSKKIRNCI